MNVAVIAHMTEFSFRQINMDITEHGCNFRQQAVSIDPTKGEFVTLGPVRNTLIATPELANGFSP